MSTQKNTFINFKNTRIYAHSWPEAVQIAQNSNVMF